VANQTSRVIQHLRRGVLLRDGAGLGDGQLLGCFIEHRDECAFAALVKRHGPLVWGVCRRLLRHHDAEDAFQATFLVLARKAASVVPREMVANWLYGVAHQTALQARRTAARRGARERPVTDMPEPPAVQQDLWNDLRPLLDEELSRLPDKYRAVIILCDLEGKTRKEAARQLRVPEGTVAGRLARARTMLARRLTRRGVSLSGGALAAVLSQKVASADVPLAVVSATIGAASSYAAGQAATGVISAPAAALTEGVLKTMLMSKLKVATGVLLVVACVGGVMGLLCPTQAGEQPTATEKKAEAKESEQPPPERAAEKRTTKVLRLRPGMVAGVVGEVDAEKKLISVSIATTVSGIRDGKVETKEGNSIGLQDLPVAKDAKITVKGKEGKLGDITVGTHVILELEVRGVIVVKGLEVKGE
jgi:RNA polymerase sigma factor (sigma-70 family)